MPRFTLGKHKHYVEKFGKKCENLNGTDSQLPDFLLQLFNFKLYIYLNFCKSTELIILTSTEIGVGICASVQ